MLNLLGLALILPTLSPIQGEVDFGELRVNSRVERLTLNSKS